MTDFNAWSETVLWTLLEVTAQASLCVLVIVGLRLALGKHLRPNWMYALWGLLLIRLLLPFSYDFTLFAPTLPAATQQPPAPVSYTRSAPAITIVNPLPTSIHPSSGSQGPVDSADTIAVAPEFQQALAVRVEPTPFPIATLLFTFWIAGVLGVLAFVVLRHFRLTHAIEREATPAAEDVSHLLRRVRDELGVSIWPVVLVSPSIAAPLVVGALRPRILLPRSFAESASPDDLRHVLMHELIHVRRRDLAFAWLWLLALALHWFNPLIWWAGSRMRRDREQACDQRVLAALPEPERIAYGHTLLKAIAAIDPKTTFNRIAGSAAIVENKAELEGRLAMIRDYRPARPHHRLFGLVTVLALTAAAFVQVWAVAQEMKDTEPVKQLLPLGRALQKSAVTANGEKYPAMDARFRPFTPNWGALDPADLVDPKIKALFENDDAPVIYIGYAAPTTDLALAFLNAYEAGNPAIAGAMDISLDAPVNGHDTLYALRRGIERAFITDISDPNAVLKAQSEVPIVWALPKSDGAFGYVLFLDGHVEKILCPSKYPMDPEVVARLRKLASGNRPSLPAVAAQTSTSALPNLSSITDEAELSRLRDEAAKSGDIIRACEAEMRRVKLRGEKGHAYKDKIDFSSVHAALPKAESTFSSGVTHDDYTFIELVSNDVVEKRAEALQNYMEQHTGDPDYAWRINHLLSQLAADIPNIVAQKSFLDAAIRTYPPVKYADPAKHSKFQHLVNEEAMLIWDANGVNAAEKFAIDTWKDDRRFAYFYAQPWEQRYAKENLPADRLEKLQAAMGDKAPLIEVKILVMPDGLWYAEKPATMEEIASYLADIPMPFNYYVSLGYTADDISIKAWQDAKNRLLLMTQKLGFDHFSDIGKQAAPPGSPVAAAPASADTPAPVPTNSFDIRLEREIETSYFRASPEVQEFVRSTAKSFGRSELWLPMLPPDLMPSPAEVDVRVAYLNKLFEDGTYGRHMCEALAEASVIKDPRLVPGLMKVAAYHVNDQDYDCRPKWMAVAALSRQEDERAVPVLVPLVDHGNLNTRMWAQAALARITGQAFHDNKQAWADWWNGAGKQPELGPDAVKPWTPPAA